MHRVNIADPDFEYDADDIGGFRSGLFRPGPRLGARHTGASVYDVPPGQSVCPYHYEYAEQEWLLAVAGRPLVRTPGGGEPLARGRPGSGSSPPTSSSFRAAPRARSRSATTAPSPCACSCGPTS